MAKLPRWRQNLHLQVWMPGCHAGRSLAALKHVLRQGLLCCIGTASRLTPASTGANKAVALYQLGQVNESMREMRCVQCDGLVHGCCCWDLYIRFRSIYSLLWLCRALLRRYPEFADVRAALTAALWGLDKVGDAETNWQRISDPRCAPCYEQ